MAENIETVEEKAALEAAMKTMLGDGQSVIGHFGSVKVEGDYRQWWSVRYGNAVNRLLTNPDYKVAQILSVLGSEVRLAILRCVLPGAKTASEVVAEVGLGTSGQAYHHLRELERGGYVTQKSGKWHFDMRRGRVYLTALALAADAGAEDPSEDEKAEEQSLPPNASLPVPALPVLGAWLDELGKTKFPPVELLVAPFPACTTAAQTIALFEAGRAAKWQAHTAKEQAEVLSLRANEKGDLVAELGNGETMVLSAKKATASGKAGCGAVLWFNAPAYPITNAGVAARRILDKAAAAKAKAARKRFA